MNSDKQPNDMERVQGEQAKESSKGPETQEELRGQIGAQILALQKDLGQVQKRGGEWMSREGTSVTDSALVEETKSELISLNQEAESAVAEADAQLQALVEPTKANMEADVAMLRAEKVLDDLSLEINNPISYLRRKREDWASEVAPRSPLKQFLLADGEGMSNLTDLHRQYKSQREAISELIESSRHVSKEDQSSGDLIKQEELALRKKLDAMIAFVEEKVRNLIRLKSRAEEAGLRKDVDVCGEIITAFKRLHYALEGGKESLGKLINSVPFERSKQEPGVAIEPGAKDVIEEASDF